MDFEPRLPDDGINVSKTHPVSELALLLGGLVAVVLLLMAAVALSLDWIVPRLPVTLEKRIFAPTCRSSSAFEPMILRAMIDDAACPNKHALTLWP